MIPDFNNDGNLPEGIHKVHWDEFYNRFGTNYYRKRQLAGLKSVLENLKNAGCKRAYVDGSFVTSKNRPNDFDGCWEPEGVDPYLLDPVLLNFDDQRKAQKTKYRGEMFLCSYVETKTGRLFLDFFQIDANSGTKKGIIFFNLEELA